MRLFSLSGPQLSSSEMANFFEIFGNPETPKTEALKKASLLIASAATSVVQHFKPKRHPHFCQNDKADLLERARQDANRIWIYGR